MTIEYNTYILHWPKFQKLHIYCFSNPSIRSRAYFHSTSSGFQNMGRFWKLPYLGMKLGHWREFQNVAHMSFYPRESKFSLFSLYGQRFPRYRQIFKISIFGHETWPLVKVPEVAHIYSLSYPPSIPPAGVKFHSVLLCGCPFPRYWQFFIFLLATTLNFNLFFKIKFKISKFL